MTGSRLDGSPERLLKRHKALKRLHAELFPAPAPSTSTPSTKGKPIDLPDDEIIRRAERAKNSDKFKRLWNGDTSGYGSLSEADLALCGMLAFWCQGDAARIDRLFRKSGLMRAKWARQDYSERAIAKAVEGKTEFYKPREAGHKPKGGGTTERRPSQATRLAHV